jgi:hypothetical protein
MTDIRHASRSYPQLKSKDLQVYFEAILKGDKFNQYYKTRQRRRPMKSTKYIE